MTIKLKTSAAHVAMACALVGAVSSGCSRSSDPSPANTAVQDTAPPLAALPLTTADTGPVTLAPAPAAIPRAPPARVTRVVDPRQRYAYLDRAYAAAQAYGDSPPDYAYDYDGTRPWVWRGDDGSERVAERTAQGLRYYYYEPGAQTPYLVQDPDYTYGYSDGQLASVYHDGALLSYEDAQRQSDLAGRYLARANALYAASLRQQRLGVAQAHWEAERAQVAANQARWAQEQSQYADWQAFHQQHVQQYQDHYASEQVRRDAEAARYAQSINDQNGAARALQAAQQARAAQQAQAAGRWAPHNGGPTPVAGPPVPLPPGPPMAMPPRQNGFGPEGARPGRAGPSPGPGPGPERAGPGSFGFNRGQPQPYQQPQPMNPARTNGPPPNIAQQSAQRAQFEAAQAQAAAHAAQDRAAAQAQAVAQAAHARTAAQADREAAAQAAASARAQQTVAARAQQDAARQAQARAAAGAAAAQHARAAEAMQAQAQAEAQAKAMRQAADRSEAASRQAQQAASDRERAQAAGQANAARNAAQQAQAQQAQARAQAQAQARAQQAARQPTPEPHAAVSRRAEPPHPPAPTKDRPQDDRRPQP